MVYILDLDMLANMKEDERRGEMQRKYPMYCDYLQLLFLWS